MITHDHGLTAGDDVVVRRNWEATELVGDKVLEMFRESRAESCAPWCVPAWIEEFFLSLSQYELIALVHVMMSRLVDREELDLGLDTPTPP